MLKAQPKDFWNRTFDLRQLSDAELSCREQRLTQEVDRLRECLEVTEIHRLSCAKSIKLQHRLYPEGLPPDRKERVEELKAMYADCEARGPKVEKDLQDCTAELALVQEEVALRDTRRKMGRLLARKGAGSAVFWACAGAVWGFFTLTTFSHTSCCATQVPCCPLSPCMRAWHRNRKAADFSGSVGEGFFKN